MGYSTQSTGSGSGGGGTPADTVVDETGYGQAASAGTGTKYSREFHTHGTQAHELPAGGSLNQVLAKNTTSDYGVTWVTPTAVPSPGTVVTQTSYGLSSADGTNSTYSRSDHAHGTVSHDNLDGLTDVTISGAADGQTLQYVATQSVWKNVTGSSSSASWPAGYFGTGVDGALTFDGTSTILGMAPTSSTYLLTQDIYATTIVINSGVTVKPDQYRIFASVSINNSGTIRNNGVVGGNGGSGSGGTGAATGDYTVANTQHPLGAPVGINGGNGGAGTAAGSAAAVRTASTGWGNDSAVRPNFSSSSFCTGGAGTDSGGTSRAGGPGPTAAAAAGKWRGYDVGQFLPGPSTILGSGAYGMVIGFSGGGGAGLESSAGGGGGGTGGGCIYIAAPTIDNAGTIQANGGAGGNAFTTKAGCGGGGGQGGVIALVYNTMTTTGTIQANGGAAGANSNITGATANSKIQHVNSATDAALYTGTNQTPVAAAQLLFIHTAVSSGTAPTVNSFTGTGGWNTTYTLVTTTLYNSNLNRLTVYRFTPASTTLGNIVANLSGTAIGCQIETVSNSTWTTTEANLVVQDAEATGNSTTPSATLAALGNAANMCIGLIGDTTTSANVTAGSGYTEVIELNQSAGAGTMEIESTTVNTANSTTVNATITSGQWGIIALEILSKIVYSTGNSAPQAGAAGVVFNFTP